MTLVPTDGGAGRWYSTTRFDLPDGLSFDEWLDAGRPLLHAAESVMWWVGDWLNYGEKRYGLTYQAAFEVTQIDTGTLADAKWVAGRIESSDRSEVLSWTHHRAVAALPAETRRVLLRRAEETSMSVVDLKREARLAKAAITGGSAPPPPPFAATIVVKGPPETTAQLREVVDSIVELLEERVAELNLDGTSVSVTGAA